MWQDATGTVRAAGWSPTGPLNYSAHTANVISRVKRSICCVSRTFRKAVPTKVLCHLFCVLMRTVLLYAAEVVYPTRVVDRVALERCQLFACRVFLRSFDYSIPYSTLLSKLGLQSISHTVFARRLSLFHAYLSGARVSPPGLLNLVSSTATRSSSRSNHSNALVIPLCRVSRCSVSVLVSTATAYNCLPQRIIDLLPSAFKREVSTVPVFDHVMGKLASCSCDFVLSQAKINLL